MNWFKVFVGGVASMSIAVGVVIHFGVEDPAGTLLTADIIFLGMSGGIE